MEIKHSCIHSVLLALAAEIGQAAAAALITENYHALGGGDLPLVPGRIWNNQQNIFHRWIEGRTVQQREKIRKLVPAILESLPDGVAAQLLAAESQEYRALDAAERSVREAKSAFMRSRREIYIRQYRADRNSGPAGGNLFH